MSMHSFAIADLDLMMFRYHVPEHIQPHIDYITPGITVFDLKQKRDATRRDVGTIDSERHSRSTTNSLGRKSDTLQYCDNIITPACVQALYNIHLATTAAPGNELGIYEEVGSSVVIHLRCVCSY